MPSAIYLGDASTWPAKVRDLIEDKAGAVRSTGGWAGRSACDLPRDEAFNAQLTEALCGEKVAVYHATRLLPEEVEHVRTAGLRVLSHGLRAAKLAFARTYIGEDDASLLERSGPLSWDAAHQMRLGQLWVMGPIGIVASDSGVDPLLVSWGGESFHFGAGREAGNRRSILDRLREVSSPTIVEVAAPAASLTSHSLGKVMVGTLVEAIDPSSEWYLVEDIPAEDILDVIQPDHPRWEPKWAL